jgi:hypothetical protein
MSSLSGSIYGLVVRGTGGGVATQNALSMGCGVWGVEWGVGCRI